MYSNEVKAELDQLSAETLGSRSRWRKLVEKGSPKLKTEKVKRNLPDAKEGEPTFEMVEVPVLDNTGQVFENKRYTVDEIRTEMQGIKARNEAFIEAMRKNQEERRFAEVKAASEANAKAILSESSDSALP
jgi:hypothetical protein